MTRKLNGIFVDNASFCNSSSSSSWRFLMWCILHIMYVCMYVDRLRDYSPDQKPQDRFWSCFLAKDPNSPSQVHKVHQVKSSKRQWYWYKEANFVTFCYKGQQICKSFFSTLSCSCILLSSCEFAIHISSSHVIWVLSV